jgi:hypothetical protein
MVSKKHYKANREAKMGQTIVCPSCGTVFVKTAYNQIFCKSKSGTICKDKYWNTVTPQKRCNTTRISPASQAWMESQERFRSIESLDEDHPFSSSGLGQWDD